jgi:hypothetical protein
MKIILFSLLSLVLIGITSYSYAEYVVVDENTELPQVLLQFEIRDSNGNFISYVETEQIVAIDNLKLNRFLDNLNNTSKEFFIKDDIKYEIQQWKTITQSLNIKFAYSTVKMLDAYQNNLITLLDMRHDSFQTQPGDVTTKFWTVIRPVS